MFIHPSLTRLSLCGMALISLGASSPEPAALLLGKTVSAMHYHLSQPDSGQTASASCVVGQGMELQNFGVPIWELGQPLPGMFNINFTDKKIVVSLAIDQPTTGYGDYLMLFLPDTLKIYDVVINPATNWAGFTESDLYVDTEYPYVELFLNGLQGQKGQKVSLDLISRPPRDPGWSSLWSPDARLHPGASRAE